MEEKELKTSPKQRIIIGLIAVIMIGSMIASYAAIVLNGNNGSSASSASSEMSKISEEKAAQVTEEYEKKSAEFSQATKSDFDKMMAYKSEIKAFNEASANESETVAKKELVEGTGEEVKADGSNYLAYYIGYCADESIFDSSLNDPENPTGFAKALDPSLGMIEGWTQGVAGMKIGGIRRITVPEKLAYGDSMEICGGKNKPLRFIVMAVAKVDPLKSLAAELDQAYLKYQYAQMGWDYDDMMKASTTEASASEGN